MVRARGHAWMIVFAFLSLMAIVPALADGTGPWDGFTLTADYDAIVDGYNEKHLEMPEEFLKALDEEWVVFYFYKTPEQVQKAGTRTVVTTHSAVFKDGLVTSHTPVEFPDPTLRIYMTEKAFYEFVTGERGPRALARADSLRYDAAGFGKSLRLSWLRLTYGIQHLFKPEKTFMLYVPLVITGAIKKQPSFAEVSHCASAGQPNVMVQQLVSVKNCSTCSLEYLSDSCLSRYSLLELSCGENHTLEKEIVDCSQFSMICSSGACARDTSRAKNLLGFTAAERLLALSSQGLDCYESDSGNEPGERGTVFWRGNGTLQQFGDFCLSSGRLAEFFCSGSSVGSEEVSCPGGKEVCFHGACRPGAGISGTGTLEDILAVEAATSSGYNPCADSDNGDTPETAGTVTLRTCPACAATTYADECMTSAIIREQSCAEGKRRERYMNCQDIGYEYCDAGRCTSEKSSDVTNRRLEEQMEPDSFLKSVVNEARCVKQRATLSMFAGDARDRVFYKACDACNYTTYEEDCYKSLVYEFDCASPDGPVKVAAQACSGAEVCYWGACRKSGNITDYESFVETERQAAIDLQSNCTDTDDGIAPRTFGRVELRSCPFCPAKTERHMYVDTCASGTEVSEQYCEGETRQSKNKDCAESGRVCLDGACVFP